MTKEKPSFSETASDDEPRDDKTMRDVDHTHPHTNQTFGTAFQRGPAVAADGGEADAESESESDADETMSDVDHESPGDGVNRTYERGTEGRTDSV
jgi:hypothetical protein